MNDLTIITHVRNEEMLMPYWLKHHLPLAKEIIVIDHHSTDNTVPIIRGLAPEARIVKSNLDFFEAKQTDEEVMEVEQTRNSEWCFVLNISEFIFCKELPCIMKGAGKDFEALGFRAYMMVDNDLTIPLEDEPIFKRRTWGYLDDGSAMNSRRARYMHREDHGHYALGRHNVNLPRKTSSDEWNILFMSFSPWPQAFDRKISIQKYIPIENKLAGSGIQHLQNPETLNNFYQSELAKSGDLMLDYNFKRQHEFYCGKSNP